MTNAYGEDNPHEVALDEVDGSGPIVYASVEIALADD